MRQQINNMTDLIPIIIPAYEPDEKLTELIKVLAANDAGPVIVVDDGSGEGYAPIFEKLAEVYKAGKANDAASDDNADGAGDGCKELTLLIHEENKGKGRALKTAFAAALEKYPNMLGCVTIDSDGQHSVKDMKACMDALVKDPDKLIMGCRDFSGEDVPKRSSFGNRSTSRVMRFLTGLSVSDTQTGLRAIPAEYMRYLLNEKGERYEFETNMLIAAGEKGIGIVEVPIETIYIDDNSGSHFNPLTDSIRIYALFFKYILSSLSSSVVDLVGFSLLCHLFKSMSFSGFTVHVGAGFFVGYIVLATIGARVISATYNFSINYKAVFKSEKNVPEAVGKYAALAVIIMLVSGFAVDKLYSLLPVAELLIKIPVDVVLFLLSFWVQREFVYK